MNIAKERIYFDFVSVLNDNYAQWMPNISLLEKRPKETKKVYNENTLRQRIVKLFKERV